MAAASVRSVARTRVTLIGRHVTLFRPFSTPFSLHVTPRVTVHVTPRVDTRRVNEVFP